MGAKKVPTGTAYVDTILNRLDVQGSPCTLAGISDRAASCDVTVTPTDLGHIAPGAVYVPSGSFLPSLGATVIYADPAPLTITADDLSRAYGADNPELTVSYAGFVLGEGPADLDGTLACTTTAVLESPVGGYPIACDGLTTTNYDIDWIDGTLDVTAADLTITVDDDTRVYGADNPDFTVSYAGFVLGEGPADLDGTLTCTTTAVTDSAVGGYPIACDGLTTTNYDIDWIDGTLDVTAADLTITAQDAQRVTGVANPSFSVSYAGFVAGDDAADLDGTLACTTTAVLASPVGDYPITCDGLTSTNYDIAWVDGTLEVLAAPTGEVVDDSNLVPGGDIDIDTGGWMPGTTVTVTVCGIEVGTAVVDADGRVRATFPLPADLPVGECEVVISGTDAAGEPYSEVLGITVAAAPTPPAPAPVTPAGVLPYTGGIVTPLVAFGGLVLAAGAALVALFRRRLAQA
nr:MBG domain-containing protein [Rhabdothermincola salaria]